MTALQDFSQELSDMGFVLGADFLHFKHACGTEVRYIPLESEYEVKKETVFQVIVHEDIWLNHKNAVINRLTALTGNTKRIHGRECSVIRIDSPTARNFLDLYHTGGFVNAYFKYGLFFRNELVAVGLFGKCKTFKPENEQAFKSAELTRYASKTGIRIAGGMNKIMSLFCREYRVYHIMTYADKEWTDGKSYVKLGFDKIGDTPPLQFRVNKQTGQRIYAENKASLKTDDWVHKSNLGNMKLVKKIPGINWVL